jgi:hypothetical protein
MLDRLISGAGAVTDGADRSVRLLAGGPRGGFVTTRPVSLAVAVILVILAAMLVLAGIEATDPAAPVPMAAAAVAVARDLGDRTYSTIHGSLATAYVETFVDDNDNGVEDVGESTADWYYFLVDPVAHRGVTVRSARPPETLLTFQGTGVLVADPHRARNGFELYGQEVSRAGLTVDATLVIDTTLTTADAPRPFDLAASLPPAGSNVEVSGPRLGSYVGICSRLPDLGGECDPGDVDRYEITVFDRASHHAIRVLLDAPPEFGGDATITGSLRRAERSVDFATQTKGLDLAGLGLRVSDRYILDEAGGRGSAPVAFAVAAGLVALAVVILIGLAGGYMIYRRSDEPLPPPATMLAAGEGIPVRITGRVRTPSGQEHVREAPGRLIRFVTGRRVADADVDAGGPAAAPAVLTTTLIVQRDRQPHGVGLGLGQLRRLSRGRVMTLRAPRPAVRVVAETGPLLLSFDTDEERDRASAELLAETGLGPDGKAHTDPHTTPI